MKYLKSIWITTTALLYQNLGVIGQIREPFDQLDLSGVSSQFFFPQTLHDYVVPTPNSYDSPLSSAEAAQIFYAFDKACLDPDFCITDMGAMRQSLVNQNAQDGSIPISILDITYHDFVPEALSENLIYYEDDKLYDTPGRPYSPLVEKEALISWIHASEYATTGMKLKLDDACYITNRGSMPTLIEMDFDDGLGWRVITFNQYIIVDYGVGAVGTRQVKTRITRNGTILKTCGEWEESQNFDPCAGSSFPMPTLPPWPVDPSDITDFQVHADYNGSPVYGNAYTLVSDDGIFDKPFLFAEGIDFGWDNNDLAIHLPYQNGNFGWCQFTSGFVDPDLEDDREYGYNMLELMPILLNELRANDYDIVLLDFYDGADYVEKNSAFTQHVLHLCNQYKTGDDQIVLSGASMGGQITRHALRSMELNGEDHCVRLWVSLDSPHTGSYIPAALQEAVKFSADNWSCGAIFFRDHYLKRPASLQLMNYQVFETDLTTRNAYYSNIDAMGWPEKCRTMGIANGRGDGVGLTYASERLMDWECSWGAPVGRFWMYPLPGDPATSFAGLNLLGDFRTTFFFSDESWNDNEWYAGFLLDGIDFIDKKVFTPATGTNWDYAPGGTRPSLKSFAVSLNKEKPGWCNYVGTEDFNDRHQFIPSASALGIHGVEAYDNLIDLLDQNLITIPFDHYEFAQEDNEAHSEVTLYSIDKVLEEVLGPDLAGLGAELTSASPNGGVFNYGKPEFAWLRDIHIHSGGQLHINRNELTHFAGVEDYVPTNGLFEVETGECSPADIVIGQLGLLEVGDISNNRPARLVINRDSHIELNALGILRINPGSSIVIKEGAELILNDGLLELKEGAQLLVEPGGRLVYNSNNASIVAKGTTTSITFNGGELHIAPGQTFTFTHDGAESGYIEFVGYGHDLFTGTNSKFKLQGDGPGDVILKITDFSNMLNANFGMGTIELINGKVQLDNGGGLWTDMKFIANNVVFEDAVPPTGTDGASVQVWHTNTGNISNSQFTNTRYYAHNTRSTLYNVDFEDVKSGVEAYAGSYWLTNCDFVDCNLDSENLGYASRIVNSYFNPTSGQTCVEDESEVELSITGTAFTGTSGGGVYKQGGKLTLRCNLFNAVGDGVFVADGLLNMSSSDMAGYNVFEAVDNCILLDDAEDINLYRGFNNLAGYQDFCILGTLNVNCPANSNCAITRDALNNHWGMAGPGEPQFPDGSVGPAGADIDVVTTTEPYDCVGDGPYSIGCDVNFLDDAPGTPNGCGTGTIVVRPVKSLTTASILGFKVPKPVGILKDYHVDSDNPMINTASFVDTHLDSALVIAATFMEAFDSLGNDATAVDLFFQILTDSLNRNNSEVRWKMEWGQQHMKSAIENLFLQGELNPESNSSSFELPVQQYVDVLNTMTDTLLTDSTYQSQFYLELDKAQLFRTIGQSETARFVYDQLDNCPLDSLQQSLLNNWLQLVDEELSVFDQYINDGIAPDSLNFDVDTTGYTSPVELALSEYYFGLWIDSPNDLTFMMCGNDPGYKTLQKTSDDAFDVFPNPNNGVFSFNYYGEPCLAVIEVYNSMGGLVHTEKTKLESGQPKTVRLDDPAAGTYSVTITTGKARITRRIVVNE